MISIPWGFYMGFLFCPAANALFPQPANLSGPGFVLFAHVDNVGVGDLVGIDGCGHAAIGAGDAVAGVERFAKGCVVLQGLHGIRDLVGLQLVPYVCRSLGGGIGIELILKINSTTHILLLHTIP